MYIEAIVLFVIIFITTLIASFIHYYDDFNASLKSVVMAILVSIFSFIIIIIISLIVSNNDYLFKKDLIKTYVVFEKIDKNGQNYLDVNNESNIAIIYKNNNILLK